MCPYVTGFDIIASAVNALVLRALEEEERESGEIDS
jgi:hypothetical protein